MRAKFEGNPITCLCVMAVFLQVREKKPEKTKKMSDFLKAYISGTAGTIYFRSGLCFLPICWHLHSNFALIWSRDHGTTNVRKIVLCSSC